MAQANSKVHRLLVNDDTMDMMIRAIAKLSSRTKKFETLRDVVVHVIRAKPALPPTALERFFAHELEGAVRVYLRMTPDHMHAFEAFRDVLCASAQQNCSVREVVCFCCFLVSEDLF